MGDSLVKDPSPTARLRRLFSGESPDVDADADPSPLPTGRLEPAVPRWSPVRRVGTQWQAGRTHRHPSMPPVPPPLGHSPLGHTPPEPLSPEPLSPESLSPESAPASPAELAVPAADGRPRPRLRIDPRFRQRRIEVKREEGRRRLRLVVVATSLLAVVVAALGSFRSPLLAARHVRVAGEVHTSTTAILAAAHLNGRPAMIDIHSGRDETAVERLPWIAHATVHRSWPDAVEVTVTERTPVAQIASVDGPVLVDATGRVLAPSPIGATAPMIAVDGGSPPIPAPLAPPPGVDVDPVYAPGIAVAAAMPAALVPHVVRVVVVPGRKLGLQLTGGASAVLGDTSDLPAKLTAVLTLVERVQIGRSTIDATVPSAPVLTRG